MQGLTSLIANAVMPEAISAPWWSHRCRVKAGKTVYGQQASVFPLLSWATCF